MNKDTMSKSPDNPRPSLSKGRVWLFRIIAAFVAPALVLVLLEVILRAAGFGYPAGAFVRGEVKGRPVYCSNNRFGRRFFPAEFAREFPPLVVPADPRQLPAGAGKVDDTYRIFILGESAAYGDPDPAYCFGRMLRVMLRQQYPSVNFEVFTVAVAAINSHAIVQIAKDCARLKPGLFVVYMGNNEVIGPYGAGTVFAPLSKSLVLIRMGVAIRATRIGQLMTRLVDIVGSGMGRPKIWGGLPGELKMYKQIRRDDKQMRYVYSHFRRNLEDIMRIAQKAEAKAIISTVAVNLKDCPPLASLNRPDIGEQKKQFDNFYQNGVQLERAGDLKGAIEDYLAAAQIDDTYAELQFRLGRCQWNLGQFDKARQSYTRAMELDTLRVRADSNINRIIRDVGAGRADQGIYLVDAVDVFEQRSPQACPGFEFFFEHVHLNFSGNYLLAGIVFDEVEEILPDRIKAQKVKDAGPPSEDVCAELLAFTDYDNYRVTQKCLTIISEEPFVSQAYHDEIMDFWRQRAERLRDGIGPGALNKALEQYEEAIRRDTTDRWLRVNFARLLSEGKKNTFAAAEQYRLITEQMPDDHRALAALASLEVVLGDIDSALKHATRAIEIMPTDPIANYAAGLGYEAKGQQKRAQRYFAGAIRFNPKFVQAYANLGRILIRQGRFEQAERVYREGIEAVPESPYLHLDLASLLRKEGMFQEAERELQKAMSLDPNIAEAVGYRKLDRKL